MLRGPALVTEENLIKIYIYSGNREFCERVTQFFLVRLFGWKWYVVGVMNFPGMCSRTMN